MKMIPAKSPFLFACSSLCVSALLVSCGEKKTVEQVEVKPNAPAEKVEEVAEMPPAPKAAETPETDATPEVVEPEVVVDATDVMPDQPLTAQELKVQRDHPWTLENLSDIRVRPGEDSPKVGDTIYAMKNVPTNKCGEYWVMDPDGYVNKLAVCHGDPEDPNHTH